MGFHDGWADESAPATVASLFAPGGTHAPQGEFAGITDLEVSPYVAVLSEPMPRYTM